MCVVQTGCAHVRRASLRFPREVTGERKRRAKDEGAERGSLRESRWREGENEREMEGYGRGRGTESKQNLHGNSVPVGRVELRVFNAVHFALSPNPSPLHRHPLEPPSLHPLSLHLFLSACFPASFCLPVFLTLSLSLCFAVSSRFNVAARKLLFLTGSIILPQPTR